MYRIFMLLLLSLLLAASVCAGEYDIAIATADVSTVTYNDQTLQLLTLDISSDLAGLDFISGTLALSFGPVEGGEERYTQLQVAEWVSGEPFVPSGKFRPLTVTSSSEAADVVHVNLRAILEPLFAAGQAFQAQLAFGLIADWDEDANEPVLCALDPSAGLWGELHLVLAED